jgi:hypothetical protein
VRHLAPRHRFFNGVSGLDTNPLLGDVGWNTGGTSFDGKAAAWEVDTSTGEGARGIPEHCASGRSADWPVTTPCLQQSGFPANGGAGRQVRARSGTATDAITLRRTSRAYRSAVQTVTTS